MKKSDPEELVEEVTKVAKKKTKKKKLKGNMYPGSDLMALVFGGGFPFGFVNCVGDSSSGKSFLAGEFIGSCYHDNAGKIQWFYDDVEKGFKFDSKKLWGIDVLNDGFFKQTRRSSTIEDFERNIYEVIEKKDPDLPFIYVIDSWDAITSEAEIAFKKKAVASRKRKKSDDDEDDGKKKKKEKGTYGLNKQKDTHSLCRTLIRDIEENKIIVYIVSQVKENINATMFGKKLYRTGGKALDFYPNVVFWLAEIEKHMVKKRPYGITTKLQATKSRSSRPFRQCFVEILFEYGVDNIASNLKFLYDLKTAENKDSVKCDKEIIWDDFAAANLESLIDHIEEHDLQDELKQRVQDKWEDIEAEVSEVAGKRKSKW